MEKLRFTIPKPCHADWNKMTPDEQGRHCAICEKTVTDFSVMTTDDIIRWLQNPENKKSNCGRFTEEQLQKGIDLPISTSLSFMPFLRKAAAVTLIGLSVSGLPLMVNGQTVIVEEIPAQYETITVKKLVKPAEIKVIEIPTEYETIERKVLKTVGNFGVGEEIPAQYETIIKKKLVKPAEIKVIEEPAEYITIEKKILVEQGGFAVWQQLPALTCDIEHIPISTMQTQLKNKGYYEGAIDDTLNEATEKAVINFRRDNNLLPIFEVDKQVLDLLGIEVK